MASRFAIVRGAGYTAYYTQMLFVGMLSFLSDAFGENSGFAVSAVCAAVLYFFLLH
jgi:hypothetical protein